jgi:hypothetical protein
LRLRPLIRRSNLFQTSKTLVIWAEEIKKPKKAKSLKALSVKAGLPKLLRKQLLQKKRKVLANNKRAGMNDIKSICRLFYLSDEGAFGTCILTTMNTRVFSQWAQWLLIRFLLIRVPFKGHNGSRHLAGRRVIK